MYADVVKANLAKVMSNSDVLFSALKVFGGSELVVNHR